MFSLAFSWIGFLGNRLRYVHRAGDLQGNAFQQYLGVNVRAGPTLTLNRAVPGVAPVDLLGARLPSGSQVCSLQYTVSHIGSLLYVHPHASSSHFSVPGSPSLFPSMLGPASQAFCHCSWHHRYHYHFPHKADGWVYQLSAFSLHLYIKPIYPWVKNFWYVLSFF